MIKRIKFIYSHRHTLKDMVIKELKAKYSNSILGISWAIVNPLLIMLVISFVFTVVFKVEMKNFPLFILSGILPWMFFSAAISESVFSIINQAQMLRQFNIPKEILPLSSIFANFLNFLLGWIIILPVFLFFKPKAIILLPALVFIVITHLIFIAGLGVALSVLNVRFRDIGHLLGVILMFWLWVTPVFYSIDMIPLFFRKIYAFNPMTCYIISYRNILFEGIIPQFHIFAQMLFWAGISLIFGEFLFIRLESSIIKRI